MKKKLFQVLLAVVLLLTVLIIGINYSESTQILLAVIAIVLYHICLFVIFRKNKEDKSNYGNSKGGSIHTTKEPLEHENKELL